MKKTLKMAGIIVLAAVIGFGMTGCDDKLPEHTHTWGEWQGDFAPTCLDEGEGTRYCTSSGCDGSETAENIPALGHNYAWHVTTASGCDYEGEETQKCTRDAGHIGTTRPVAANPSLHIWELTGGGVAPTCTTTGSGTEECSTCGEDRTSGTIPALGHNYVWVATTPATYIAPGQQREECNRDSCTVTRNTSPLAQKIITTTAGWTDACSQLNGKTGSYTLTIDGEIDVAGTNPTTPSFGYTSEGSLTVIIVGNGKLTLTSQGVILSISNSQTVVINSAGLTLEGLAANNAPVVYINGSLELKNGIITGNYNGSTGGGGVNVNNGELIMSGGTISNNTAYASSGYSGGGGVLVGNGSFSMSGGIISGNTTSAYGANAGGGGVYVNNSYCTFTMTGGTISGNTANTGTNNLNGGGGVYVGNGATFTMSGSSKIHGNKASGSGGINAAQTPRGGGVHVWGDNSSGYSGGTFIMKGGTISGNQVINYSGGGNGGGVGVTYGGEFFIENGIIYGDDEGEMSNTDYYQWPNSTALFSAVGSEYGKFGLMGWEKAGSLSTTNDTIKIVNGVKQ